jgi:FkbM family methyltransferase
MLRSIKRLLVHFMALTPYNIRRRLPTITLDPLEVLLTSSWACEECLNIIQVGACDGTSSDPIHQYLKSGTARAILIEPNPSAFQRLERAYSGVPGIILIQAALGKRDGEATLYRVKESGKTASEIDWSLQFASFSRAHVKRHGVRADRIEAITVPCRTISSLIKQHGMSKIDVLQIDAEGFDASIVRAALKLPMLPKCINFEHSHLALFERNPLYDSLKSNGYLLCYDSWNILAIQRNLVDQMRSKMGPAHASAALADRRMS